MPSILLVEDNHATSEVFASFLDGQGHQVLVCENAASAIKFINSGTTIDIAFVDYWLVNETADSVLRALHDKYTGTPVILITGGSKDVSVETTKWLGALDGIQGFLQKPFSFREIEAIISKFS